MSPEGVELLEGERLDVPVRLVVTGAAGTFRPLPPETVTTEGEIVMEGQAIGVVEGPGASHEVCTPFRGFLMGMLAEPGERVREGQPVAWLRAL